jgi:uncharacterized protein YigE (DUF2233 family)
MLSLQLISLFWLLISPPQQTYAWKELDKGLSYAVWEAPMKSTHNDSKIHVLRIDPNAYDFFLECATDPANKFTTHTIDEWCVQKKFLAAINAGMFDGYDPNKPNHTYMCNRGYMKSFSHVNSSVVTKDRAAICFARKDNSVPAFQVADIQNCTSLDKLKSQYNCVIQGIRMVDCKQQLRWQKDQKRWSVCVMGMDKKGNALFIHSRSPYTMYDFITMVQKLPLDIRTLIYLEGGPEASLYINVGNTTVKRWGSYETGFNENDANERFWKLPNVVGIRKKV